MKPRIEVTIDKSKAHLGEADTHSVFVPGKGYLTNMTDAEARRVVKDLAKQLGLKVEEVKP